MIKNALFVRLEAKPGKEKELAHFLQDGLDLARQEGTTPVWFALQLGPSTFGIFDAFSDELRHPSRKLRIHTTDTIVLDGKVTAREGHTVEQV